MQTKEVLKKLDSLSAGVARTELLEQSGSFVFTDNHIYAFNDEILASTSVSEDLEGAIEALPLLSMLRKIKDDEIKIWQEGDELRIKGKRFESGIKFESDIKLPINDIKIPEKFKNVQYNFSELCKLACLTASKSLSDPLLTFVHFNGNKIESCDNDRITICELESDLKFKALVSAKSLLQVIKEPVVGIALDEQWLHFKTKSDVVFSLRTNPEIYVDVQSFVPKKKGTEITLPEEIINIISRADVFSKDTVSLEKTVEISIKEGKLLISAQNDSGWFKERCKTKYSGPDISFSINSEFLRDILKLSNSIEVVKNLLVFRDKQSIHFVQLNEQE